VAAGPLPTKIRVDWVEKSVAMWDFNHQNMGFRWISHCLTNKRGKIGCFHKRHLQAAGTTEKRARNERD